MGNLAMQRILAKPYSYMRIDGLTLAKRQELEATMLGARIPTDRPTYAVVETKTLNLIDWPFLDSEAEAREAVADFNRDDDDGGAASERLWQARMGGDLEA